MHLPPLSRGPAQHLLAAFLLYCNVAAVPLLRDMAAAAPAQPQLALREQLRSFIDACRPRLESRLGYPSFISEVCLVLLYHTAATSVNTCNLFFSLRLFSLLNGLDL